MPVSRVLEAAEGRRTEAAALLRRLIAIPSFSGREGAVTAFIAEEMERRGFDAVRVDGFGNVSGRIGSGPRLLAFDAHVDTVEPGERAHWEVDPFEGAERDGFVLGRGASDQKGGMAALLVGGSVALETGVPDDVTLLVVGSVQEEDCDGLCWQYLVREEGIRPEGVVLTEPTGCAVYRGQRGRMEIEIEVPGVSAHGSAPERGVNAVTASSRIALEVDALNGRLAADPLLGKGSVAVTRVVSSAPSLCAVPDRASLHLDRRLTRGETPEEALEAIRSLASVREANAVASVPEYRAPTHTGLVYPAPARFPCWVFEESHPWVGSALEAARAVMGPDVPTGCWTFSTNGVATAGIFGIPTVGFGPGDEAFAHGPRDRVPVDDLVRAVAFTALFPRFARGAEGTVPISWEAP